MAFVSVIIVFCYSKYILLIDSFVFLPVCQRFDQVNTHAAFAVVVFAHALFRITYRVECFAGVFEGDVYGVGIDTEFDVYLAVP